MSSLANSMANAENVPPADYLTSTVPEKRTRLAAPPLTEISQDNEVVDDDSDEDYQPLPAKKKAKNPKAGASTRKKSGPGRGRSNGKRKAHTVDQDQDLPPAKRSRKVGGPMGKGHTLQRSDLEARFHLSFFKARTSLGIAKKTLEDACNRLGIIKWPSEEEQKQHNKLRLEKMEEERKQLKKEEEERLQAVSTAVPGRRPRRTAAQLQQSPPQQQQVDHVAECIRIMQSMQISQSSEAHVTAVRGANDLLTDDGQKHYESINPSTLKPIFMDWSAEFLEDCTSHLSQGQLQLLVSAKNSYDKQAPNPATMSAVLAHHGVQYDYKSKQLLEGITISLEASKSGDGLLQSFLNVDSLSTELADILLLHGEPITKTDVMELMASAVFNLPHLANEAVGARFVSRFGGAVKLLGTSKVDLTEVVLTPSWLAKYAAKHWYNNHGFRINIKDPKTGRVETFNYCLGAFKSLLTAFNVWLAAWRKANRSWPAEDVLKKYLTEILSSLKLHCVDQESREVLYVKKEAVKFFSNYKPVADTGDWPAGFPALMAKVAQDAL